MIKRLCIGGPLHGQRVDCWPTTELWFAVERAPGYLRRLIYRRWRIQDEHTLEVREVFVLGGMTRAEAISRFDELQYVNP